MLLGLLAIGVAVRADFELLLPGYYVERVYTPGLLAPNHVAVSPSGIIVVTDWGSSDRVLRLHADGSLTTYASPSDGGHFGLVFDAADNLYVSGEYGVLWRVTPGGDVSEYAQGVAGFQMDIAPDGQIYATGGDNTCIHRIGTDGQVSVYADGLTGPCDVAVSPTTGDVFVLDFGTGTISRANPDGTLTPLVTGLVHEWSYIACSPAGELYYWALGGELFLVSVPGGSLSEVSWVKENIANLHPTDFAFDALGRIVTVDCTYNHVVRLDLTSETAEMLWTGMGNAIGLAATPAGELFMTYGHPFSDGHGGVVRIDPGGTIVPVLDDLGPDVCGLAFDSTGTGYVISTALVSGDWRSTLHAFSAEGAKIEIAQLPQHGYGLEFDPSTGNLWGLSYGEIWYFDAAWNRHVMSTASVGEQVESLTFTPDGTLYVNITTSDDGVGPVAGGLYRVDPGGPEFTLVADLSTVDMCCPYGRIAGGQDGYIYWAGHADRYTQDNEPDMHMLRITSSGKVTLLARDLPMDPAEVASDPASTDLYVSSGCGVYRVFQASSAAFRVEAWGGHVLSDGTFRASAFQVGAADVAEWVDVREPVEAGDVIEFDPTAAGLYRPSSVPCSHLVAGVVSTAPGVVLGGSVPPAGRALLALAGIVPVKVTDEGGAIRPGDLLVTSSMPGYAMRWSAEEPCPCALVGKALASMTGSRGVILALLTSH